MPARGAEPHFASLAKEAHMVQYAAQRTRVLALLIRRGAEGITQADFLLPDVADGGRPITRLAARIEELRNHHGVAIDNAGVRGRLKVYVLAESAVKPTPSLFENA